MEYFFTSYKIIDEVLRGGGFSSIKLNENLNNAGRDTAIITKIVYGVIDKSIELDYIISKLCKSAPKPAVKNILKLGIYCLKYMSIPDYAVISNSLKLCEKLGKSGVKGFLNGVLNSAKSYEIEYPKDNIGYLSVKYSIPVDLVKLLINEYGDDIEKILSYQPDTREHIRVNLFKTTAENFEKLLNEKNIVYEKSNAKGYYINYSDLLAGKISTEFYTVMGYASMYVINLLDIKKGANILDACAAPGGKSVYMAEKSCCNITACDIHLHRAELIEKYIKRTGAKNINVQAADSSVFNAEYENKFDLVLCDVPCSGFGMVYKKPEIKINTTAEDIINLSKLQLSILKNCGKYVKSKGTLIYSTCTIFKQENEDIINEFLNNNKDYILSERLAGDKYFNGGFIKLVGGINSGEGFFMAELIKL